MMAHLDWSPTLSREIPNGQYGRSIREKRLGVCLHYDASGSDAGSMGWFAHEKCRVSYNWLVLDDGSYVTIAPDNCRAWHAGRCRTSDRERLNYRDANSALYGIAAATNNRVDVTPLQLLTIAWLTRQCFVRECWPVTDTWRIVGHSSEAWPRGRKSDPEGGDKRNPIYSPADIRQLLGRVRA